MLFRRDIEPYCGYCQHSTKTGENQVLCTLRDSMPPEEHCPRFRYDPLKRIPPRPVSLRPGHFKQEDFSL